MGNMHYLAASSSGGGSYTFLIVIVVLFGLLYFVMIRPQRNASHRISATADSDIAALRPAFRVSVAKPSSLIGTSPVCRMLAW